MTFCNDGVAGQEDCAAAALRSSEDFLRAAERWWSTPFEAALSISEIALMSVSAILALSLVSMASSAFLTWVFMREVMATLYWRLFSFVRLRFFCDFMFAMGPGFVGLCVRRGLPFRG